MNLKHLSLTVLVLALLSGLVAWLDRPSSSADADPRLGTRLLEDFPLNDATTLSLHRDGNHVALSRNADGAWQVDSFHRLPADTAKLRRLFGEVHEAKIERFVTRNPERAARLDLDQSGLTVTSGEREATVALGRTASRGGRYLRLGAAADAPAYLTLANISLDGSSQNWVQSDLTTLAPEDVESITLEFGDASTLSVTRADAESDWASMEIPPEQTLLAPPITGLLNAVSNLRFNNTAAPDTPDVTAAREHERRFVLTTFDGRQLSVSLGRRPEEVIETEESDPATETEEILGEDPLAAMNDNIIPAGPVYVRFDGPTELAPLAGAQDQLAFEVPGYLLERFPESREDLIAEAPTEASH